MTSLFVTQNQVNLSSKKDDKFICKHTPSGISLRAATFSINNSPSKAKFSVFLNPLNNKS